MRRILRLFERGNVPMSFLFASVALASASVGTFLVIPVGISQHVEVTIEPLSRTVTLGNEFSSSLMLESSVPVNAFEGTLRFDTDRLEVISLQYDDSVADLWVEPPHYDNHDGTISFIGGTTHLGGFIGSGPIVLMTFKSKTEGAAALYIDTIRVLRHDGEGTDAPVETTDASYLVERLKELPNNSGTTLLSAGASYTVTPEPPPSTDLNHDGVHTVADLSIFMLHFRKGDYAYDFNQDGRVNSKDLSIILKDVRRR